MVGFKLSLQKPPEAKRINDDVIMRFDHVYEIAPEKMQIFPQQDLPAWDTLRIVASRWDHLDWMHAHWADSTLGAEEIEAGADAATETETEAR